MLFSVIPAGCLPADKSEKQTEDFNKRARQISYMIKAAHVGFSHMKVVITVSHHLRYRSLITHCGFILFIHR